MIKNLNLVVTESAKGALKVAHIGTDRAAAQAAFRKICQSPDHLCVVHIRNPKPEKRKFPIRAASIKAEASPPAAPDFPPPPSVSDSDNGD